MNGLLKPSNGDIIISGYNITDGLNLPVKHKKKVTKAEINDEKRD